jgi:hypothetical protein
MAELPLFDGLGLLRLQLAEAAEPCELSAAEIAALPVAADEPPPDLDEVPWWLSEEFTGSDPELAAAFARSLPADVGSEYAAGPWTGAGEAWGAGFGHHDAGAGPRGDGFAAGGEHDVLAPGPELAAAAAGADGHRGQLGESELIGVLCGWQRLAAWAQTPDPTPAQRHDLANTQRPNLCDPSRAVPRLMPDASRRLSQH